MKNELMIDIETTGQKPGCKVLSLGAYGFDKDGFPTEFYKRFSIAKQDAADLEDDQDTMSWWFKQGQDAMQEAFSGKEDPLEAIGEFKHWFYRHFSTNREDRFLVWCCGVDFDFPILEYFFRAFGYQLPWKFWNQNDYRTLKNVMPKIKMAENNAFKHNALEDCKAQMRGLQAFYKLLNEPSTNG